MTPLRQDWSMTTEQLLSSCGDSRHTVGPNGRNRYGNRYSPEPGLLSFGSCTSSTVSEVAFAAADRLHGWLRALGSDVLEESVDDLYERVRTELMSNIAMDSAASLDVVLCPSGTDAELVPLLVALAEAPRVTTILVGASEAGSGTGNAARGVHFDPVTPSGSEVEPGTLVDPSIDGRVRLERVGIRDADGAPTDEANVDGEVRAIVGAAIGRGEHVLLHIIAHSKTGVHAPSLRCVDELVHAHPRQVDVVIDAAQGRFSRTGLAESLARGYMVMVTGSKFFGGPPFAGAVLVPHERAGGRAIPTEIPQGFGAYFVRAMLPRTWREARATLAPGLALGVLMRWWAALAEIRDYYSVPAALRLVVFNRFHDVVPEIVAATEHLELTMVPTPPQPNQGTRLLESNTTVFPFACRTPDGTLLGMDQLRELAAEVRAGSLVDEHLSPQLAVLRSELGQPVELASGSTSLPVLRIALGGRDIIRTCVTPAAGTTFDERLERLEREVTRTLQKVDALVAATRGEAPVTG
jgi:hypothetical protein